MWRVENCGFVWVCVSLWVFYKVWVSFGCLAQLVRDYGKGKVVKIVKEVSGLGDLGIEDCKMRDFA